MRPSLRNRVVGRLTCWACWLAAVLAVVCGGVARGQTKLLDDARNRMVDEEIASAGVKNARVLEVMRATRRHEFVAPEQKKYAYLDMALPIGDKQTISPPFIVAYMTEQIDPQPADKVLEIGTGSGYQAAVLAPLCKEVYTIEIVPTLGEKAARALKRLKYDNVSCKVGDGYQGWAEHAPFDKIIVTCSPEKVPQPLIDQLREGGRMIVPIGERYQQTLYLYKKQEGKLVAEALRPTLFVPMTGTAEDNRQVKPDPLHPQFANGSFEEVIEGTKQPFGWHYQRQMEWTPADDAPAGKAFVTFANSDPGRGSLALQGFAIDGRKIEELEISLQIRGADLRPGQSREQVPLIAFTFYDENRATVAERTVGPWLGSFDWRTETGKVRVPLKAREAIVRLGLQGATGELAVDDLKVKSVKTVK